MPYLGWANEPRGGIITFIIIIPVREGSGDPKSEDIPCSGDITMIMDSLGEFLIDTDPLRDLFSQPVAWTRAKWVLSWNARFI